MLKSIQRWEARTRAKFNCDLSNEENERKNRIYRVFFDHELIRGLWTNFYQIAPGVYRSNHPTWRRFKKMKRRGMKTVLNLRGKSQSGHYWAEEAWCEEIGLTLVSVEMNARALVPRDRIQQLIDVFRTIERPFVMHCKSGADRAGLASAIYLMVIEGQPIEQAKKMLSPWYFHIRNSHVGILDYMLDCYEAHNARTPMSFETWIATVYDPVDITDRFRAKKPPQ
ncbi:MAG: tyrosine-protein phosphatase [Rhodobacteraceae bacterium]|nr:tyrosine-protein phosphatase [Paracoccaceae bacterium]